MVKIKSLFKKYEMGITVGLAWGIMMVIGYELTKVML